MVTVYSPLRSVLHMNSKDLSIWILPSFFVNVASITYQNGKSSLVGGGGGGRPNMAQAGGKNPDKIPEAIAKVAELVEGQLK